MRCSAHALVHTTSFATGALCDGVWATPTDDERVSVASRDADVVSLTLVASCVSPSSCTPESVAMTLTTSMMVFSSYAFEHGPSFF